MAVVDASGAAVVVLHQEDQRQVPQLGHVQAFVEHAFVHGAVAKEDHGNRAGLLQLVGQRGAGGQGGAAADDGRGVRDVQVRSRHVERAAAAEAVAGLASDDFRQHLAGVAALGDDVAVVPVGAEEVVLRRQRRADADAGGLLPDVDVKVAADESLVLFVEPDDVLFRTPDHEHLPQQVEPLVA